jgi:hypothetical protein
MSRKVRNHCGVEKDEKEFNWRHKVLGVRNPACRECQHAFNKEHYEGDAKEKHVRQVKERTEAAKMAAREFVYNYLLAHRCEMCGERDPIVLEFHHKRPINVRFFAQTAIEVSLSKNVAGLEGVSK